LLSFSMPSPEQPSPLVVKLQIAAAVFLPMALLGLWLHSQGFW
jgi:hypothetical protein